MRAVATRCERLRREADHPHWRSGLLRICRRLLTARWAFAPRSAALSCHTGSEGVQQELPQLRDLIGGWDFGVDRPAATVLFDTKQSPVVLGDELGGEP